MFVFVVEREQCATVDGVCVCCARKGGNKCEELSEVKLVSLVLVLMK